MKGFAIAARWIPHNAIDDKQTLVQADVHADICRHKTPLALGRNELK